MRLAIITTHPIQYYAPVFKLLAQKIGLMVFYTWGEQSVSKHDPGFGKTVEWDIDLLDGYSYQWVDNTAADPGSHHFKGIVTPGLIAQITEWEPDALLVYGWAYHGHLAVMRHFKNKVPILFRGDSTLLDERPGLRNSLRPVYLKWIYRHISCALYTGTSNRAYFKKYGVPEQHLIFAPHAVDNKRFGIQQDTTFLRQQLHIDQGDIVVLFAGKLEEKKAPGSLLTAFISLASPGCHLIIVGAGILEVSLKQQADKYPNIHFMDFQNQTMMPAIYQMCDLFCLPSAGPGESWGLAVNEAMAAGKAVLVSDKAGCAADLVRPGVNGYVHSAGSVADLSAKMSALIRKGKDGLALMGDQSRKIVQDWSFENQATAIITYKNDGER